MKVAFTHVCHDKRRSCWRSDVLCVQL